MSDVAWIQNPNLSGSQKETPRLVCIGGWGGGAVHVGQGSPTVSLAGAQYGMTKGIGDRFSWGHSLIPGLSNQQKNWARQTQPGAPLHRLFMAWDSWIAFGS